MGYNEIVAFIADSPAKLANQFDNGVFRDLFGEHAFYTIVALAIYIWLAYQIFKGDESNRFRIGMTYTCIILVVCIGLLYFHPYLTNCDENKYIVSRSIDPVRMDSILKESRDDINNSSRSCSTKFYVFLWNTSLSNPSSESGHLAVLFFDRNMTYLSHHPRGGAGLSQIKTLLPSENKLAEELEKHKPDQVIIVPDGILKQENIDAIVEWSREPRYYKGKYKNCADTVKQALKAGNFYLANPSLRLLTFFGLSVPNTIADRIVFTLCLREASYTIQHLHHILNLIVWLMCTNLVISFLCSVESHIPNQLWLFFCAVLWIPINTLLNVDRH